MEKYRPLLSLMGGWLVKKRLSILLFLCFFVLGTMGETLAFTDRPNDDVVTEDYGELYYRSGETLPMLSPDAIRKFGTLRKAYLKNAGEIQYFITDENNVSYELVIFIDPFIEELGKYKDSTSYAIVSNDLRKAEELLQNPDVLEYEGPIAYYSEEGFAYHYYYKTSGLTDIYWTVGDLRCHISGNFKEYPMDGSKTLLSRLLDKRTVKKAAKEIENLLREEFQVPGEVSAGSAKIAPVYWWILGGIGVAEAGLLMWILLLLRKVKRQLKTATALPPQTPAESPQPPQAE